MVSYLLREFNVQLGFEKNRQKFSNHISCYRKTTIIIPLLFPFAQLEPLAVISKSSLCPSSKEDFLLVVENPLQLSICY